MQLKLDDLGLRSGQRHVCSYSIEIAPLSLGGAKFDVVVPEGVTLGVERIAGGFLLDIGLTAVVCGPCARCLREVCREVEAQEEEFIPTAAGGWEESDTQTSPFVDGMTVDVAGLAREAVVLGMPDRMLCTEDCRGLCPECGKDLNEGPCSCAPLEL